MIMMMIMIIIIVVIGMIAAVCGSGQVWTILKVIILKKALVWFPNTGLSNIWLLCPTWHATFTAISIFFVYPTRFSVL